MRSINYLTDRPAKILFSICFPLVGVNLLLWITTTWTNQLYSRYVGADAFAITGYLSAVTTAFANIVSSIMLAAWIKTAHTFALNDKEACSQQIFNGIAAATIIDCTLALLLLLFCHPLFSVLHIPEMIHASAKRYFILYTVCYLPVVIAGLLLTVVNGTSGSARLFWINIIVVLLNYAAAALLLAAFHAGIVGLALCSGLGALFQLAFDFFLFRKAGFHISVIRQMRHISIAQQVFRKDEHPSIDGTDIGSTDTKRMVDAYLSHELKDESEKIVKYAKSAVDMCNQLTHDRNATKRAAAICIIGVSSIAALVKEISETEKEIVF